MNRVNHPPATLPGKRNPVEVRSRHGGDYEVGREKLDKRVPETNAAFEQASSRVARKLAPCGISRQWRAEVCVKRRVWGIAVVAAIKAPKQMLEGIEPRFIGVVGRIAEISV